MVGIICRVILKGGRANFGVITRQSLESKYFGRSLPFFAYPFLLNLQNYLKISNVHQQSFSQHTNFVFVAVKLLFTWLKIRAVWFSLSHSVAYVSMMGDACFSDCFVHTSPFPHFPPPWWGSSGCESWSSKRFSTGGLRPTGGPRSCYRWAVRSAIKNKNK